MPPPSLSWAQQQPLPQTLTVSLIGVWRDVRASAHRVGPNEVELSSTVTIVLRRPAYPDSQPCHWQLSRNIHLPQQRKTLILPMYNEANSWGLLVP